MHFSSTDDSLPVAVRAYRWLIIVALLAMTVLVAAPPAALAAPSDNLAGATVIPTLGPFPFSDSGTTTTATREAGEDGTCGNFPSDPAISTRSVWYKFTPSTSGWLVVDTLTSSYDTVLEIYVGNSAGATYPLVSLNCNDDARPGAVLQSLLSIPVAPSAGLSYYIMVRSFGSSQTGGSLTLHASFSSQQQIYVDGTSGNDANPGTHPLLAVQTIQKGVNIASTGANININTGTYNEQVVIHQNLSLTAGGGAVLITGAAPSVTLTSGAQITLNGAITANSVQVDQAGSPGARIADGVALVVSGGTITVGNGTYAENLTISKDVTLTNIPGQGPYLQPAAGTAINVTGGTVTLTGLNIVAPTGLNSAGTVTANDNWWGNGSGPGGVGGVGGTGSQITGSGVTVTSWCFEPNPTCTSITAPPLLEFVSQPQNGTVGVSIAPPNVQVRVQSSGSTVTSFTGPITLIIGTGPGGVPTPTINGASSVAVNAVSGVATFTSLIFNRAFNGYILSASTTGLTSVNSGSFNIGVGTPTVTIDTPASSSFTFGDPPFTVGATTSPAGLAVTFSSNTTGVCTVSGTAVTIVAAGTCTIQATITATADYNSASTTRDFTINGASQTIQFSPAAPSGTFGTMVTVTATAQPSGNAATLVLDGSSTACTLNSSGPGTITLNITTGTGTCVITGSGGAGGNYAAAPPQNLSITVQKATQTITFDTPPNNTTFTLATPSFTVGAFATPSGLPIVFASASPSVCTVSGTTVTIVAGGTCVINANQPGDPDYSAANQVTNSYPINRIPAIFTISVPDKTYDGTPLPVGTVTWTSPASQPGGHTLDYMYTGISGTSYGPTATPPTNAGTYQIVATLNGPTYGGSATDTATIMPKPVTFTVSVPDKTYDVAPAGPPTVVLSGGSPPLPSAATGFSFQYIGTAATSYGPTATAPANAGTYQVTATPTSGNYSGTANAAFTINKATQSISGFLPIPDHVYGDPSFALSATATSGLPVDFSATGNCTFERGKVFITGAGSCTITASQPGNANWVAAADVPQTFTINKVTQSITFNSLPTRAVSNPPFTVSATATSGLPVSFSATGGCSVSGTTVTLSGVGTCTITASQPGDANWGAAADVPQTFLIVTSFKAFVPLLLVPPYPDLVGSFTLSDPTVKAFDPVLITVTITNNGNAPASNFWVDFYINPLMPPTATNQPWDQRCGSVRCKFGIAWYVADTIAPGKSIKLYSTASSYYAKNTDWPGYFEGTKLNLYLYVDSWNPGIADGAVIEKNEANNRAELHLGGVQAAAAPFASAPTPTQALPALPDRPARPSENH